MSEELELLITTCKEMNAIILNFNLYNEIPTAIIELNNGTPMSIRYDLKEKVWK